MQTDRLYHAQWRKRRPREVKDSAMDTQQPSVRAGAECVVLASMGVREPGLSPGERQRGPPLITDLPRALHSSS